MLTSRGLGRVLADLAEMGYDARWGVLGAVDAGAPHKRDRIWILAHSDAQRCNRGGLSAGEREPLLHACGSGRGDEASTVRDGREADKDVADAEKQFSRGLPIGTSSEYPRLGVSGENVADANGAQREGDQRAKRIGAEHADISRAGWWATEPNVGRVVNGLAAELDIP